MSIGEASLWFGDVQSVQQELQTIRPELMVSLLGSRGKRTVLDRRIKLSGDAPHVLSTVSSRLPPHFVPASIMTIDWPDYDSPWMPLSWWQGFVDDLRTVNGDVVIFCAGGHGRTGTAASILASLSNAHQFLSIRRTVIDVNRTAFKTVVSRSLNIDEDDLNEGEEI